MGKFKWFKNLNWNFLYKSEIINCLLQFQIAMGGNICCLLLKIKMLAIYLGDCLKGLYETDI